MELSCTDADLRPPSNSEANKQTPVIPGADRVMARSRAPWQSPGRAATDRLKSADPACGTDHILFYSVTSGAIKHGG